MTKLPCKECRSKCCKYVAVAIDTPTTSKDFDNIRWYLLHENVNVFIDLGSTWHVEFVTRCTSLAKNGDCTSYDSRPAICSVYGSEADSDECEYFDTPYQTCFSKVDEFEAWLSAKARRPRKRALRSA